MKTNKPFILLIPSPIIEKLDNYLKTSPNGDRYKTIYFYYIIHYLTSKHLVQKDQEYIKINMKYLKSVTVSNITSYIKILENGEFIKTEAYIPGVKSKGYKLNFEGSFDDFKKVHIEPGTRIFNRIKKNQINARAHNNRFEPFLKAMNDKFMKTELDYQSAEKWIYGQPDAVKRYFYLTSLNNLQDSKLRYFRRNKTNNRLDTNFTNLKKELRQFIQGEKVSIDLKNSQPFFLGQMIKHLIEKGKKKGNINNLPYCSHFLILKVPLSLGKRDLQRISKIHQKSKIANLVNLRHYIDSTINGTLYDDFLKLYSGEMTRDEAKEIILKVLFSSNRKISDYRKFIPYESEKKKFASVFPFIYEIIETLKAKDHAALAIYLQKLESYIFIDCIAKELFNNGIVPLTIHDSIIIDSTGQEKALSILHDIFRQNFGVVPSFTVEPLSKTKPKHDLYHIKKETIKVPKSERLSVSGLAPSPVVAH